MRGRAENRFNSYRKAKRKQRLDKEINPSIFGYIPYYNNLHQYSKNKIHCSCAICSAKYRNKGKRRKLYGNYAPNINPGISDLRKIDEMNYEEKEYYSGENDNG